VKAYGPRAHTDTEAFRRIGFTQGTAAAMPFEDGRFDLVFSRLAIEQMNAIQDKVFREIARICGGHAAMIEPFTDFAETPLQRLSTEKKNHFGAPVAAILAYGLSPVAVFSDWPQKLTQGSGLVVARRSR
jgi:ubiquinone/menaquinone biosynthesis C-methylase UbiE